jgi:hypothetical protein
MALRRARRPTQQLEEQGRRRRSRITEAIISFEEPRRRRDESPSPVRRARCGKMILATAIRCPECGVHFQGEAQDYLQPSEKPEGSGRRWWVVLLAVVLQVALALAGDSTAERWNATGSA